MNTTRRKVTVRQCEKCPNIYMTVGKTAIGLAFPRPVTTEWDISTNQMMPLRGVCPIHKRRIDDYDPS